MRSGIRVVTACALLVLAAGIGLVSRNQAEPSQPLDPREALTREGLETTPAPAPDGRIEVVELVAAPATKTLLDGRAMHVWAFNGEVPGPTIRARVGDRVRVHLRNRLAEPTSIHWHGVRLPNAMDGVPGVTQAAVAPGEDYVYEFVAREAGTFWYHPHVAHRGSEQIERGLHGMLVIEERTPSPVRDVVLALDDWRLGPDGQIDPAFVTRHDLAHDGRWGSVITANARVAPDVEVRPGERVRVRLANVANGRVFAPDFGGLDAKLVAFDGHPTAAALDPAGLELAPGNRADVEIVAPSDGRSIAVHDRFTGRALRLWTFVVKGAPVATPASTAAFARVPAFAGATALEPDAVFRLNATRGGPYGITWSLRDTPHAGHGGDPSHVFRVDRFAKVRFVNESAQLHPMHLHGQVFKVVARDGAPVDERHLRDTVLVHPRETVDVGLVPHDLGSWVLHCHVLEHHDAGMMTVVAVRP